MEKISEEYPSAIVRENGLSALPSTFDFFPTGVQPIALQAAANCCRNFSSDNFALVSLYEIYWVPLTSDFYPSVSSI